MPVRQSNLFGHIASFPALCAAAEPAAKGKRSKAEPAGFLANLETNVLRLERELTDGTWRPGRYTVMELTDPKPRRVSAAPFRDRVVHHALCGVVGPLFERGFIPDTYANRTGFGTHRAIARYEQYRDRFAHVLRCDIYRYFPAIDHAILKSILRRRVSCERTLSVLDRIIDGSNAQEPVDPLFPGDDLFTPQQRRRGLPIGNLTSQFFGNLYLDAMDHFVKERLRAPGYVRYVDDFALFHDDPAVLAGWRDALARHLEGRRLRLHPRKTMILRTAEAAEFLGLMLAPGGHRSLPADAVSRFRRKLRSMRDRFRNRAIGEAEVRKRVGGWIAHAEHADTWRLRQNLFRGGWFDPAREPDQPDQARGAWWFLEQ